MPAVLVAVLVVPALVLWSAIADHAIFNAQLDLFASQTTADGTPVWLDPATTSLPWWLRAPWSWLGHGHGRQAAFLVLFVAAVLVDARRLARYPEIALRAVVPPAWLRLLLSVRLGRGLGLGVVSWRCRLVRRRREGPEAWDGRRFLLHLRVGLVGRMLWGKMGLTSVSLRAFSPRKEGIYRTFFWDPLFLASVCPAGLLIGHGLDTEHAHHVVTP